MNRFRLLNADEIECRVSQIKETGLSLLLYKTARTDANLLDETVGEDNWSNDFKLVDGVLYGGIGVNYEKTGAKGTFIWKWDAGVESNTEAEKGRASDAFKRAGFKHGIGRELYTAPFVWIPKEKCNITKNEKGKLVCYDSFEVQKITYNDKQEIASLTIVNAKTRKTAYAWTLGNNVTLPSDEPERADTAAESAQNTYTPQCVMCGKEISDRVHDYSVKVFKKPLCRDCQDKIKNESKTR